MTIECVFEKQTYGNSNPARTATTLVRCFRRGDDRVIVVYVDHYQAHGYRVDSLSSRTILHDHHIADSDTAAMRSAVSPVSSEVPEGAAWCALVYFALRDRGHSEREAVYLAHAAANYRGRLPGFDFVEAAPLGLETHRYRALLKAAERALSE